MPGGVGWYRKKFVPETNSSGQRIYVYFEGIYRDGEVFINGVSLGKRPNGYISCLYDLTQHLRPGETNTLAVRVDHAKSADSRWYTGSGIYRDVYLVYTGQVHISKWGIYYSTSEVTAKQTIVKIEATLVNHKNTTSNLTVNHESLDDSQ